jgi:cytidylate kinase
MSHAPSIPVITVDGPTASGKGTVAERVAEALGFHYLDSGALYRLAALAALNANLDMANDGQVAACAANLDIRFAGGAVFLAGQDVTGQIRAEAVGNNASRIAVMPALRAALLRRQHDFRQAPGLVADGRDMGTVVFPDARVKIFLTASVEKRAERRSKQLIEKGFSVNMSSLLLDLRQRDERDSGRESAPLKAAPDALLIDSSDLSVDQVVESIVSRYRKAVVGN